MVCRAVVSGSIPGSPMDLQVSTNIQAEIMNDGASVRFRFTNTEESGLNISQFSFSFDEDVTITGASSEVPGGSGAWAFSEMTGGPQDYVFGATGPLEGLTSGQEGTFIVTGAEGTFSEELLDGLQVCLVYQSGTEGQPGFIQGRVCGAWVCDADDITPPIDRGYYPFDRSLNRMESALARLLDNVQYSATFPADLPEVEKILKLVFLKNQLITILAQEYRTLPPLNSVDEE